MWLELCHTHEPLCMGLQMEGGEEGGAAVPLRLWGLVAPGQEASSPGR